MANKNEAELVIKAKRDAEKAIDELTKSLQELDKAAEKNSIQDLFFGFDESADNLLKKKKLVDERLADAKAAQRALKTAAEFSKSVDMQTAAVDKTAAKLAVLESVYDQVAEAATQAREPAKKLTEALESSQQRQAQIIDDLRQKAGALAAAQSALADNQGIDDKAAAAIDRQRKVILEAGKAWRELTTRIAEARKAQAQAAGSQQSTDEARKASAERLAALQEELRRTRELFAQLDKARKAGTAGGATQRLALDAKTRLAELTEGIKSERQLQAQLNNDYASVTAKIRAQESAIAKLTDKARAQRGIYSELSRDLNAYAEGQRKLGETRQAAQIDSLTRGVANLTTQLQNAEKRALGLSEAISKSAAPDPKAVRQFEQLSAQIAQTRSTLAAQQATLAETVADFNAAGVSAEALAKDEQRLAEVTERLTKESGDLAGQMDRLKKSSKESQQGLAGVGKAIVGIGDDTRKSLGFVQRIKGELLALAATYAGIYAVGDAVKSIYEAGALQGKAESRFSVFFGGDTKRVAEELKFVRAESDRLGISYETALDQYSKFVSGLSADTPIEYARQVFSGFSTAATVAKISEEELKRVFSAVTQIFGKQQVQLEELKGQLADALPGAIQKTADALKLTVPELTKLVEEGRVGEEAAILLAAELQKAYGVRLDQALKGPQAQLNLFRNAVADLKKEIGQSGFLETLTDALKEVTKAVKTEEFKKGAKEIANGIAEIIKLGVSLVKNFKEVKDTVELLLSIFVAKKIAQFAFDIVSAGKAVKEFGASLTSTMPILTTFFTRLGTYITWIPALAATALGSYFIGDWLQENVAAVRKYGVQLVTDVDRVFTLLSGIFKAFRVVWDAVFVKLSFEGLTKQLEAVEEQTRQKIATINSITKDMMEDIDKEFAKSQSPISSEKTKVEADKIKTVITDLEAFTSQTFSGSENVFPYSSKQAKEEAEKTKNILLVNAKDVAEGVANIQKGQALLSEEELAKIREKAISENTEKQANALKKITDNVKDRLAEIDREILEKSGDTLETRLGAIAQEYTKLLEDIRKAGGNARFPGAEDSVRQITAIKQVEEIEKEINKLITERKELSSAIYERAELGEISIEEAAKRVNSENARIIPLMDEALNKAREISNQIGSKPITQSVNNQEEIVNTEKLRASREQLLNIEKQIDSAMDIRASKLQTIAALEETGAITEYEAKQKIIELNLQTNQQLSDELALLEQLITSNEQLRDSTYGQETLERIKQAKIELGGVKDQILDAQSVNEDFASGFTNAFDDFISGTKSAKEAFKSFIADFLRNIAKAILQALIFRAISGGATGGGGLGGTLSTLVGQNHSGGMAGSKRVLRQIDPTSFIGAVRYHTGGLVGYKPNEVPIIAEKNEEVLTRNDPRHVLNGGMTSGGKNEVSIYNTIDVDSLVDSVFSHPSTSKKLVNIISTNKSSFKAAFGGG